MKKPNIKILNIKNEIEKSLLKSEEDIEKGRTRDAKEVFEEWKKRYGLKI